MGNNYSRHHSIIYRGNREEVDAWDDRSSRLINAKGVSREKIYLTALDRGFHELDKESLGEGTYSEMEAMLAKKMIKQREEEYQMRGLSAMLDDMGIEKFTAWGEITEEVSQEVIQRFLADHTIGEANRRQNVHAQEWLSNLLLNKEPLSTREIHKMAIADSIIDDSVEGWHWLRCIASRAGLTKTNVYGTWGMAKVDKV